MPRIARSLATLRDQVNARWPTRSKSNDGWIGDTAHAARRSDHNPNGADVVQALDLTHDPAKGFDSYKFAESLRQNRDPRIKYVISNGRIFSSKVSPWQWRPYNGVNAHAKHVHVSVNDNPAQYDDGRPWALNVGAVHASRFDECVVHVLKHEGGYVNHPADPGGATNMGITLAVYRDNIDHNGTADDLRRLTVDQAKRIYRNKYWDALNCDQWPAGIDYAVFDFGVNSGVGRAKQFMQNIQSGPPASVINALCDARLKYLQGLPHFRTFGRGWTRRVKEVRATALEMAGRKPASPTVPVAVGLGIFATLFAWLQDHPVLAALFAVACAAAVVGIFKIMKGRNK